MTISCPLRKQRVVSEINYTKPTARLISLVIFLLGLGLSLGFRNAAAQPIQLHPENPHYFLYKGEPTVLVTSAEHYGAVVNPDFDYEVYLSTLAEDGLNYTRIFAGSYVEPHGSFGIEKNTLAPEGARVLTPWARSDTPGYAGGGNKFDLDGWDDRYFSRLRDFVETAAEHDVIVEVTLFSSMYSDRQWGVNPLNPVNNVNEYQEGPWRNLHTPDNGDVGAYQEAMVRKIVGELNAFDNVIFEIQNEPLADNNVVSGPLNPYLPDWEDDWRNHLAYPTDASLEWQRSIASFIQNEEASRPKKHLIAQNYASFRYPLYDVNPDVHVLNFHHGQPDAVLLNSGWERAIGLDETGSLGSEDRAYRRMAWNFMLAGGSLFNNLDYSFTVDRPDGTDTNRAPGGGSPELREQLGILKAFLESFDFVRMTSDRSVVVLAPGAFREVLADHGQAYGAYLDGQLRGPLVLDLPAGTYNVTWIDTSSGAEQAQPNVSHDGGRLTLDAPEYDHDIALRIVVAD